MVEILFKNNELQKISPASNIHGALMTTQNSLKAT